ncbi:flap endonuclease GEN-like 1 isoform X2 [Cryptomeria japonica]|uniref:flap endonuclease GEN-like 1 isoform X2 n=1 Tax=Cryptomeria japonica TaxID=3369 RepID=UPI0027D9E00F|nr:flap endonuclease GEN-like 1 isoform X2 [Cryptomeria japonica]
MGVAGGFWDLVKPVARYEDVEYLRGKKMSVDLSYWIVQQETALKGNARKPHLRLTFFRTVNLFAKLGVFPLFVVDGDAPTLKSPTRLDRFCKMTGIDYSSHKNVESTIIARNPVFNQYIEECVELLDLMGMPVLRAKGEAEALCAQLDREGRVDACLTADSDAFLHGAKCVIKCLRVDCKEPIIECYRASDIDTCLRLKRKHLIALALLVGCDYNSHGVPGIGLNTAVRITHLFQEEEILDKLCEIGKGNTLLCSEMDNSKTENFESEHTAGMPVKKRPHCSQCGHPGNKVSHLKLGCDGCKGLYSDAKCVEKYPGWKCACAGCMQKKKEHNKWLHWQTKTFSKICATDGFPNNEIVNMYLGNETSALGDLQMNAESLSWQAPKMEFLEDFLGHHLFWDRSYTRQKILPLCSVMLLRKMAANKEGVSASEESQLLYNRYVPHSVERIKVRYSQSFYVLKWKHVNSECNNDDWLGLKSKDLQLQKRKASVVCNFQNGCDEEFQAVEVHTTKGNLFITTDEDVELVRAACPKLVEIFEYEKAAKKRRAAVSKCSKGKETSTVKQLTITSYFKATKGLVRSKPRKTSSTVGDSKDRNTRANLTLPVPLEKTVESIKTMVPVINDPVSQVELSTHDLV